MMSRPKPADYPHLVTIELEGSEGSMEAAGTLFCCIASTAEDEQDADQRADDGSLDDEQRQRRRTRPSHR